MNWLKKFSEDNRGNPGNPSGSTTQNANIPAQQATKGSGDASSTKQVPNNASQESQAGSENKVEQPQNINDIYKNNAEFKKLVDWLKAAIKVQNSIEAAKDLLMTSMKTMNLNQQNVDAIRNEIGLK